MRKAAKTVERVHRFDGAARIDSAVAVPRRIGSAVRTARHLSKRKNGLGRGIPAHSFDRLPGLGHAFSFGENGRIASEKYVDFFAIIFHIAMIARVEKKVKAAIGF